MILIYKTTEKTTDKPKKKLDIGSLIILIIGISVIIYGIAAEPGANSTTLILESHLKPELIKVGKAGIIPSVIPGYYTISTAI